MPAAAAPQKYWPRATISRGMQLATGVPCNPLCEQACPHLELVVGHEAGVQAAAAACGSVLRAGQATGPACQG